MNKVKPTGIEYSVNDTFVFYVSPIGNDSFSDGSTLKLVIAKRENEEPIIEKEYSLSDNKFIVALTGSEKTVLTLGEYVYKMIVHGPDGTISTQKSGFLDVIWGA